MLRIATRKSPLALRQAEIVSKKLQNHWPNLTIELVPMSTKGDEVLDKKLLTFGGKSLFVKELEIALLENRADIAVHSIKDLPSKLPKGLTLNTILARDNPYDAFLSHQATCFQNLKPNARIGTSSLRRQAQLLTLRNDLKIETLRGNIHTRLEKLKNQEYDAIILACAGLERMGLEYLIQEQLSEEQMIPACAQGAIGIECREQDPKIQELLAPLHDNKTALCVKLERKVNQLLGGHCHVPIAIFAKFMNDNQMSLNVSVLNSSGTKKLHWQQQFFVDEAELKALECAKSLIEQGADSLIRE